jgi:hypothetical protein
LRAWRAVLVGAYLFGKLFHHGFVRDEGGRVEERSGGRARREARHRRRRVAELV